LLCATFAKHGLGLAYASDTRVRDELKKGQLEVVLEAYAPTVPGYFIYFPSRAQRSGPLRLFVDLAKQLLRK